jgi:hypothetical protein
MDLAREQLDSPSERAIYRITLRGRLDEAMAGWFPGMTLVPGSGGTTLIGPVPDQAALYGLINIVRDLGLQLISVTPVEAGERPPQAMEE